MALRLLGDQGTRPPLPRLNVQDRLNHGSVKLVGVIDGREVDAIGSPRTFSEQKQRLGLDAGEHLASEQHDLEQGEPAQQEVAHLLGVIRPQQFGRKHQSQSSLGGQVAGRVNNERRP